MQKQLAENTSKNSLQQLHSKNQQTRSTTHGRKPHSNTTTCKNNIPKLPSKATCPDHLQSQPLKTTCNNHLEKQQSKATFKNNLESHLRKQFAKIICSNNVQEPACNNNLKKPWSNATFKHHLQKQHPFENNIQAPPSKKLQAHCLNHLNKHLQ